MMKHVIDLDKSFEEEIHNLPSAAREQIVGIIIYALETDPFFEPGDDYLFERSAKNQSCACTHGSGSWEGWKLLWYYEYSATFPTMVEVICVVLVKEPFELGLIKPVVR
jgi:hypothetical protein